MHYTSDNNSSSAVQKCNNKHNSARIHTRKSALGDCVCEFVCLCACACNNRGNDSSSSTVSPTSQHRLLIHSHLHTDTRANKLPIKRQDFAFSPHYKRIQRRGWATWELLCQFSCSLSCFIVGTCIWSESSGYSASVAFVLTFTSTSVLFARVCVCVSAYTKVFQQVRVLRRTSKPMTLNSPK